MTEALSQYLADFGPACKQRLAQAYSHEVEDFTHMVGKIQETLAQFYAHSTDAEKTESAHGIAYSLMYKSANTLMAAFELALSGYKWEPPILFRNALEGCAAAWDIVSDEGRFKNWQNGKSFKSSKSVSRLSEVDETYGRIWGELSNNNVHISKRSSSPALFRTNFGVAFQLFGFVPVGKEENCRDTIEASLLAALACLRLTEVVFYPFASNPESVTKGKTDDHLTFVQTGRHNRVIDAYQKTRQRNKAQPDFRR